MFLEKNNKIIFIIFIFLGVFVLCKNYKDGKEFEVYQNLNDNCYICKGKYFY